MWKVKGENWKLKCEKVWLAEEEVGDGEGGDDADEVGDEATNHRMAGVLDADAAEVNG